MARFVSWIILIGIIPFHANLVYSQNYPNKPIRIVAPGTGGGSEFAARLIAPAISVPLGQPVVVDFRGSVAAQEIVSKATPDGYTLLVTGGTFWIGPLLRTQTPYDPVKDFAPVIMICDAPSLLVVHSSVPAKSVKELIAIAKAKPGTVNYSSGGVGSAGHLAGELFNSLAGISTLHVPYKSSSQRFTDILSGQIQMMFDGSSSALMEQVKAGKLRVLAVTSANPSVLFPDLPTVAATLPGFEVGNPTAIFTTAKTPTAIIQRLNQEIVRVINQPDSKKIFFDRGIEVVGSTPEGLGATMKSQMTRTAKVIKDAGIQVEN